MKINCIAVDDEPAALSLLVNYINQTPFLQLDGQFDNAIEALREVHANADLQLIFLDINMADLNGLELAKIIDQSSKRRQIRIVFTTAYDQYALEGFKVEALDYLLKPFNYIDFIRAANRAAEYFSSAVNAAPVLSQGPSISEENRPYVYLRVEHQLVKINLDDIQYIEGLKDYVKIYLKNVEKPILTLISMRKLEEKLPGELFLRLHRSFIVHTSAITAATKTSVAIGKTNINVSEPYREAFSDFLNKWIL